MSSVLRKIQIVFFKVNVIIIIDIRTLVFI